LESITRTAAQPLKALKALTEKMSNGDGVLAVQERGLEPGELYLGLQRWSKYRTDTAV